MKKQMMRAILGLMLLSPIAVQAQTTYTYQNANVTGTPTTPVNWSDASLWGGTAPVSANTNTVKFFQDTTTALGNTATPSLQTASNDIASPFQLGTLTLSGKGSATTGAHLLETIAGGDLNFSAATGTLRLDGTAGTASLSYYLDNNLLLGTSGSACALSVTGDGSVFFNLNGDISELQVGGGSLTKTGNSLLTLAGNNTYTGITTLNGINGMLRLGSPNALPGGIGVTGGTGALTIQAGVVDLMYDDFRRNLGTGVDQFQITGGTSGFSTRGVRNIVVNNDPSTELVWGSASFNPSAFRLMNGTIDAPLTLANNIDLNSASAARTISVNFNSNGAQATPAIITGVIRNTAGAGGLTKTDSGYLRLTGLNTFTGPVTLNNGGNSSGQMLSINYMPNGGIASPLGMSSSAASNLLFGDSAGIHYIGSGDSSDRSFTFNSASAGHRAVLEADGSGPLVLTSSASPAFTTPDQTRSLYLCGRSPLTNTLAAVLADNGTGALSVIKDIGRNANSKNGRWVLSGASTFTGAVTINNGILGITSIDVVANPNPLGQSTTAAANLILNGGILQYMGATKSTDRLFSLQSSSAIDASGSGPVDFSNTGAMGFNGGTAAKTLTLTGSNTDNNKLSALIGNNTGATSLTKAGKGTWVLNGPVTNSYTGGTVINTGTLVEDFGNMTSGYANLINSASALTLGGGTLSLVGHASNASSQTFGNPTFTASQAGSGLSIAGASGMTLTLGNTWTRNAGSTVNVTLGSGGTLSSSPAVDTSTPTPLVKGSANVAFATVGGTDWAKVSGGTVIGFVGGDYLSGLPSSGSTSTANYTHTDNATVTANETANTLKINTTTSGQSLAISAGQALTLNAGGLLFTGADDYSITGGTLKGQGGTGELVVHQYGSGNLTISSTLPTTTVLTKTGPGTLTLDTPQTFSGNTSVGGGGTLVLKHQYALSNSVLNVNNSSIVFDSAAGTNFTVGGLSSTSTAPYGGPGYDIGLTNSAGAPIVLTVNNSGTLGYYGMLSGPGALVKTGAGALNLYAFNTFTGGVTINGGSVGYGASNSDWCLGGGGAYGNVPITVNSGAALGLSANSLTTTLTLNGGSVGSGNSFGSALFGSIILQSTSTFKGANGSTLNVYSLVSGSGGLIKDGTVSYHVTLFSANTFTGDTVITGNTVIGYLRLGHAFALQNSVLDTATSAAGNATAGLVTYLPALVLGGLSGDKDLSSIFTSNANGGPNSVTPVGGYRGVTTLTLNPGVSQTPSYSGVIADGAPGMTLTKTGSGTQTLSGVNTYTGATTIKEGTLALGASGTLDGDNDVVLAGGTLEMGSFSNTLKTLSVTGNSTLALGSGTLSFANSSALTWTGNLTLTGTLGATTLYFGPGGLTAEQLTKITIDGKRVFLDASGYLAIQPDGLLILIF
jgi:fibronectin-binding autotransporter adhesin